ncbi:anti-repressor SinI family protein [Fictibacillus enclensis]|uniref:anti-repressor SinI family protein n=1 Tax=Fictibacillus enclensis TaxID=1017270 RepID=UPI0025A1382A|nr:anti-repressor SinI family protein [Fictibacillus enclensis]MDM5336215.1 anti-repressor SinI family protein [Fictibacillus enclensis]
MDNKIIDLSRAMMERDLSDLEWQQLVVEAMRSEVTKEQFSQFLDRKRALKRKPLGK